MQVSFFWCFRQGVAGTSRDLGRDVPDLEKRFARKLGADFSFPNTIFQNHYTHEIIKFELLRRLQLQLSGAFRMN